MKWDYNRLVERVDVYLRKKRAGSRLWAILLPESLFRSELWSWEQHSVARGAAWGTSWALAPVPMQTLFAVLCSIRSRGNVPMSVLSCCISFPGYQVVAWPLQWYVGALITSQLGLASGVDMELIRQAAQAATQGWDATMGTLQQVNLPMLCLELLVGCAFTCALIGVIAYCLVMLFWRKG